MAGLIGNMNLGSVVGPSNRSVGYYGPPMVNPNVPMTDFWGGVQGVGDPSKYTSGISLVKAGSYYGKGIDMVQRGDAYTRGVDMVQKGADYFNDKTIDLVDKAGNYAGLEAEAGRTLARMGGALGADQYASGLRGGGLGRAMQQSLVAEVGGNLAKDINTDKFQREAMVQEGSLAKQQGVLAGDSARMQGQQAQNQIRLAGDSARMQGQLSRNQLILQGDSARMQGQISRNQLGLAAATQNSQMSLARAQGRASDQQYGLGLQMGYNQLNSSNYQAYMGDQLAREQMYQGNLQQPYYGNTGTGAK